MAMVTGVDVEQRAVLIGERRVSYDQLVIATGARESYFGHDEWAQVTLGLKSIEDATAMRRRILRGLRACRGQRQRGRTPSAADIRG